MINNEKHEEKSILKIGEVLSVESRNIRIQVDKNKNPSDLLYKGEIIKNITVGSYVKIQKGFIILIGIIESEHISEETKQKSEVKSISIDIKRALTISLLGFIENGVFERGIKEMPLAGNICYLLTRKEFIEIHKLYQNGEEKINIGTLAFDDQTDIEIGVNKIFSGHIGIFGNTGSGKSYTLSRLYENYLPKFKKNGKFVLLDFNGEYEDKAITDKKNLIKLSTRFKNGGKITLPKKILSDVPFWSILLEATEKTQMPFIKRVLNYKYTIKPRDILIKMIDKRDRNIGVSVIREFYNEIETFIESEDKGNGLNGWLDKLNFNATNSSYYRSDMPTPKCYEYFNQNIEDKIPKFKIKESMSQKPFDGFFLNFICKYYLELIQGYFNAEHIKPLIRRFQSRIRDVEKIIKIGDVNELKNPLTVISLHDVNLHMKKMLPLLICKHYYDIQKSNKKKEYLNIIIDEAHNILSSDSERESKEWKDYRLETFEEIIKEGRKFSTFLTIASQRPADITHTIVSQIHTFILHRLVNEQDINAVRKTISYLSKTQFENLSNLPTGQCIIAGYRINFPITVKVSKIKHSENEPSSKTLDIDELIKKQDSHNDKKI